MYVCVCVRVLWFFGNLRHSSTYLRLLKASSSPQPLPIYRPICWISRRVRVMDHLVEYWVCSKSSQVHTRIPHAVKWGLTVENVHGLVDERERRLRDFDWILIGALRNRKWGSRWRKRGKRGCVCAEETDEHWEDILKYTFYYQRKGHVSPESGQFISCKAYWPNIYLS